MNLLFNSSGQTQHKVVLQMAFTSSSSHSEKHKHTHTRTYTTLPASFTWPLLLFLHLLLRCSLKRKDHHHPRGVPLEKKYCILKDTFSFFIKEEKKKKIAGPVPVRGGYCGFFLQNVFWNKVEVKFSFFHSAASLNTEKRKQVTGETRETHNI